jgi:hypothetical protein
MTWPSDFNRSWIGLPVLVLIFTARLSNRNGFPYLIKDDRIGGTSKKDSTLKKQIVTDSQCDQVTFYSPGAFINVSLYGP